MFGRDAIPPARRCDERNDYLHLQEKGPRLTRRLTIKAAAPLEGKIVAQQVQVLPNLQHWRFKGPGAQPAAVRAQIGKR